MRELRDVAPSGLRSHVEQLHWKRLPLQEFRMDFRWFFCWWELDGDMPKELQVINFPRLLPRAFLKPKKRWVWIPRSKKKTNRSCELPCFSEGYGLKILWVFRESTEPSTKVVLFLSFTK